MTDKEVKLIKFLCRVKRENPEAKYVVMESTQTVRSFECHPRFGGIYWWADEYEYNSFRHGDLRYPYDVTPANSLIEL